MEERRRWIEAVRDRARATMDQRIEVARTAIDRDRRDLRRVLRVRLDERGARLTAAVGRLRALSPTAVVERGYAIVRGADGALALTRHGEIAVAASLTEVVDTVGAGDTFNAGLLAGLARGGVLERGKIREAEAGKIESALHLAVKAAAVTVSRAGTNPPWAHEL